MSMPTIEIGILDRDVVMNNVIASIALQEAALSHILNADGEKIQAAVHLLDPDNSTYLADAGASFTFGDMLEINMSVNDMIDTTRDFESILLGKLDTVLDFISTDEMLPTGFAFTFAKTYDPAPTAGELPVIAYFSVSGKIEPSGVSKPILVSKTARTDADGVVHFALPPGTYTLLEIQAPSGYELDPTPHTLEVDDAGSAIKVDNSAIADFEPLNVKPTP
jgi:hypothetical protein